MRTAQIGLLVLATVALACRSSSSVPEPGAALLRLSCAVSSPLPDELRVWVYDESGRLWNGARIPESGKLASTNAASLGTILIAPGAIQGALRIHIRALAAGVRLADGMLSIPSLSGAQRSYDLRLEPTVPADSDGDGVPDAIDDCADLPNPGQGGCGAAPTPDAAVEVFDSEPRPADVMGNPDWNDAGKDSTPGGDGKNDLRVIDTNVGLVPDTNPVANADADVEAGNGRDAPADTPPAEVERDVPVVLADVAPDGAGDVRPDGGADSRDTGSDSKLPVDLGVVADASPEVTPVDLAPAADLVSEPDRVPVPPDGNSGDIPEEDACGTNCKKSQGDLCTQNDECASGFCTDGVCCTNACAGPCRSCNQPSATGVCQGYTAGSDPEGECMSGATCNGAGACGAPPPPDKPNGQLCGAGSECLSGFCRDGVCCNEACSDPCQSCGTGTCLPVKRADDIPECTDTKTCNAKGKCVTKGS